MEDNNTCGTFTNANTSNAFVSGTTTSGWPLTSTNVGYNVTWYPADWAVQNKVAALEAKVETLEKMVQALLSGRKTGR